MDEKRVRLPLPGEADLQRDARRVRARERGLDATFWLVLLAAMAWAGLALLGA